MQLTDIIIRPLQSEKANFLSDKLRQYAFVVARRANKLEVKTAIETLYNVQVDSVQTMVMPAKARSRFTKKGVLRGRKSAYKKALVGLKEGQVIDIYA